MSNNMTESKQRILNHVRSADAKIFANNELGRSAMTRRRIFTVSKLHIN